MSQPLRIALADPGADLAPLLDALQRGRPAIVPTDTVYGLACAAHLRDACERTLRLKGRDAAQPTAIVCGSLATALGSVLPELRGRAAERARRLLPGRVTVIVPNEGRRFPWLCGPTPDRIGLRVPTLDARLAAAIDLLGAICATSANRHGEPAPTSIEEIAIEICDGAAVIVDGGAIADGRHSTVVDVCADEPRVLREGAVPTADVLALLSL